MAQDLRLLTASVFDLKRNFEEDEARICAQVTLRRKKKVAGPRPASGKPASGMRHQDMPRYRGTWYVRTLVPGTLVPRYL